MNITFQIAKTADVSKILKFMTAYYQYDGLPLDESRAHNAVIQLIANETMGRIWLIEVEQKFIGYVVLTLGYSLEYLGRDAFIDELYLEEDYRGKGIGQQVIAFVEKESHSLGVNALHLEVERDNLHAQDLYRKVGFEEHNRYLLTKWLAK